MNDWTDSTSVFLDEFNEVAVQLKPSDVAIDKRTEVDGDEFDKTDNKEEKSEKDLLKVEEGRVKMLNTANELIHKITVS